LSLSGLGKYYLPSDRLRDLISFSFPPNWMHVSHRTWNELQYLRTGAFGIWARIFDMTVNSSFAVLNKIHRNYILMSAYIRSMGDKSGLFAGDSRKHEILHQSFVACLWRDALSCCEKNPSWKSWTILAMTSDSCWKSSFSERGACVSGMRIAYCARSTVKGRIDLRSANSSVRPHAHGWFRIFSIQWGDAQAPLGSRVSASAVASGMVNGEAIFISMYCCLQLRTKVGPHIKVDRTCRVSISASTDYLTIQFCGNIGPMLESNPRWTGKSATAHTCDT
jgi:hypothetical protein